MFRENTEGVYVSIGGRFKAGTEDEVAIQEEINTYKGVHRIIRHAFEFAQAHGLHQGLHGRQEQRDAAGPRAVAARVQGSRGGVPGHHGDAQYIDALAMFLVQGSRAVQVIVTNNLFGDIITDIGGALQGGLGMAASGNIHPGRTSLFEPVHGSAPPLAGQERRQPDGRDPLGRADARNTRRDATKPGRSKRAVEAAIAAGQTTTDIGGSLGTREVGDWIAEAIAM